jgi:hypothetical protein
MGRVGGITSPFIISESTSLRTIGIIMFLVSSVTAILTRCLPETAGRALGDYDGNGGVVMVELQATTKQGDVIHYQPRESLEEEESENVNIESDDVPNDVEEKDVSSFELI